MDELGWQSKLVDRLNVEGCHARKASHQFAVGVLDLDVCHEAFVNAKVEVKLEKDLKPGWSRTPDYSEPQKREAANVNAAGGNAMGLVVCYYSPTNVWLFAHCVPPEKAKWKVTEAMVVERGVKWHTKHPTRYLTEYILKTIGETKT